MKKILRLIKFLKIKIFRIRDFPESVAIGLSWGASVSFTPLLGLHLIICYLGTWVMRGNLIAATVGTIVGNPWTFPFFFFLDYKIGLFFFDNFIREYEFNVKFFIENFEKLFYPTLIGSLPIAIIVWFITYYISKKILMKKYNAKNQTRNKY